MRRFSFTLIWMVIVFGLIGCGGGSHSPAAQGITVTVTNVFPNNTVQAGSGPITLKAAVANDSSNSGVKWSLSNANTGCSPDCGTLMPSPGSNLSAVYTPPAIAPGNQNASISAIAVADNTKDYSFNFTIIPTTSVSITNKLSSTVAGGPGVTVNATVLHDLTNSGVNWTLTAGGAVCSPACGTLAASAAPSFAALYTPPATVPTGTNANPAITAISVAKSSASDSFSFTIANPASLLKGSYVFLLRGYDSFSAAPMAMAGTIVADGNGNITSGEVDFNNGGGITHVPSPATGTYVVDNSFNGITKGSLEISSFKFPGSNIDLQFRFVLSSDGKRGHIIELDGSGYLNSGTIQLQDSSAVSAAPSGNFAFGLDSDAPFGGRIVSAGQIVFGSSGITGGIIDQSKSADAVPTYADAPISPGVVSAPDSSGRGTLAITVNNNTSQYAYYVVDSSHIRLIQIDQGLKFGTVQAGSAVRQKTLTAASINAASVLQLTGMDEPAGTSNVGPDVIIGVMTTSNGNAFNLTFDTNDVGAILTSHLANGSITSFDPATGRAVLSSPGGFGSGFVDSSVIYLYDQGSGFFIDADISSTLPGQAITNNAFSGTLTLQTGGPFDVSALSGNLIAGFGGSASPSIPNWELGVTLDPATATYSAAGDLTSLLSQDGSAIGAHFTGTYGLVNSVLGHGSVTMPAAVFGDFTSGATVTASFYLIAPNQFVLIGINQGLYSGVAFFDPQ
jgi:hypothetical protein